MTKSEEYHAGDLIRATKGDTVITGRLSKGTFESTLTLIQAGWPLASLVAQEFDIEVIEPAPDPLPTEPGLYRDKDSDLWTLKDNGKWYVNDDEEESSFVKPKDYLPLTRLYTKAEVIPMVRKWAYDIDPDYEYGHALSALIKKLEAAL